MAGFSPRLKLSARTGQACNNRFLIVDARHVELNVPQHLDELSKSIDGYGVDSALVLTRSAVASAKMFIVERDNSLSNLCGNGLLLLSVITEFVGLSIESAVGVHAIQMIDGMSEVSFEQQVLITDIVRGSARGWTLVDNGEPHLVNFHDDLSPNALRDFGIEVQSHFPGGINVNVATVDADSCIKLSTFERGVLRVTRSCGTGSLASAALHLRNGHVTKDQGVEIRSSGGTHFVVRRNGSFLLRAAAEQIQASAQFMFEVPQRLR